MHATGIGLNVIKWRFSLNVSRPNAMNVRPEWARERDRKWPVMPSSHDVECGKNVNVSRSVCAIFDAE